MNDASSVETYCHAVEAYLCRKNEGHLIRIVGPAFEQVCGWAARGVPLKVAFRGIDRYCERYYAKGPRRRPVRVEFCEADVLDLFDEWRRALGLPTAPAAGRPKSSSADAAQGARPAAHPSAGVDAEEDGTAEPARRRDSLPAHLERVIARLTAARSGGRGRLDEPLEAVARELDASRAGAGGLRGDARRAALERLRALDATLLAAARAACEAETLQEMTDEADAELSPFRGRMASDAYERSRAACVDRLVREQWRLPVIAYEG